MPPGHETERRFEKFISRGVPKTREIVKQVPSAGRNPTSHIQPSHRTSDRRMMKSRTAHPRACCDRLMEIRQRSRTRIARLAPEQALALQKTPLELYGGRNH